MNKVRVLLADDQAKVRSALGLLLEQEPDMDVIGETADAQGLLEKVQKSCPDLVVLDGELPGLVLNGLFATLHSLCPALKVIVLSGRPEARQVALAAGSDFFVSKGDPPEQLLNVLRTLREKTLEGKRRDV
jgi:DNA-binding NarL/FixJ family response regulator